MSPELSIQKNLREAKKGYPTAAGAWGTTQCPHGTLPALHAPARHAVNKAGLQRKGELLPLTQGHSSYTLWKRSELSRMSSAAVQICANSPQPTGWHRSYWHWQHHRVICTQMVWAWHRPEDTWGHLRPAHIEDKGFCHTLPQRSCCLECAWASLVINVKTDVTEWLENVVPSSYPVTKPPFTVLENTGFSAKECGKRVKWT